MKYICTQNSYTGYLKMCLQCYKDISWIDLALHIGPIANVGIEEIQKMRAEAFNKDLFLDNLLEEKDLENFNSLYNEKELCIVYSSIDTRMHFCYCYLCYLFHDTKVKLYDIDIEEDFRHTKLSEADLLSKMKPISEGKMAYYLNMWEMLVQLYNEHKEIYFKLKPHELIEIYPGNSFDKEIIEIVKNNNALFTTARVVNIICKQFWDTDKDWFTISKFVEHRITVLLDNGTIKSAGNKYPEDNLITHELLKI